MRRCYRLASFRNQRPEEGIESFWTALIKVIGKGFRNQRPAEGIESRGASRPAAGAGWASGTNDPQRVLKVVIPKRRRLRDEASGTNDPQRVLKVETAANSGTSAVKLQE